MCQQMLLRLHRMVNQLCILEWCALHSFPSTLKQRLAFCTICVSFALHLRLLVVSSGACVL